MSKPKYSFTLTEKQTCSLTYILGLIQERELAKTILNQVNKQRALEIKIRSSRDRLRKKAATAKKREEAKAARELKAFEKWDAENAHKRENTDLKKVKRDLRAKKK